MTRPIDLHPAVERMTELVDAVDDAMLSRPTPCAAFTVGDLLDHIAGFALAFRAAAVKQPLPGGPSGDAANLRPDWRARIPRDLRALAHAWRDPSAWTGVSAAGGVELPAEVAGIVALDELVLHGWDLARALGRPGPYDGPGLDAVLAQVGAFRRSGVEGIFGPEVPVPPGAPVFDRMLGLAGRDPHWAPADRAPA